MFGALLGFWSTIYSKLMFMIYCLPVYEHWDHFMKITTNQKAHHERSLVRNLFFNLIRCMANEAFREFVVGVPWPVEIWVSRAVGVVLMTVLVHFYLPKR